MRTSIPISNREENIPRESRVVASRQRMGSLSPRLIDAIRVRMPAKLIMSGL